MFMNMYRMDTMFRILLIIGLYASFIDKTIGLGDNTGKYTYSSEKLIDIRSNFGLSSGDNIFGSTL